MPPPRHAASRPKRPTPAVYLRRRIAVFGVLPAVLALSIFAVVAGTSSQRPAQTADRHVASQTKPATASGTGVRTLTYVDRSRSTFDYVTGKTIANRTFKVEMFYPALTRRSKQVVLGASIVQRKKRPLIVFASGYRLQPSDYTALFRAWVRNGDMVAAIEFPDTTYPASEAAYAAGVPFHSPEGDIYNEPHDVAFVLSQLLKADTTRSSWLNGLITTNDVVLGGHSDGASVVSSLVYNASFRNLHHGVRGVLALSGGEFPIAKQTYAQPTRHGVPILVVQSATDQCVAPWQAVDLYNALQAPKYFLELEHATHLGPYNGTNAQAAAVVDQVTSQFINASLGIGKSSATGLLGSGSVRGVSVMTDVKLAGAIPTPPGTTSCPHS